MLSATCYVLQFTCYMLYATCYVIYSIYSPPLSQNSLRLSPSLSFPMVFALLTGSACPVSDAGVL